MMELQTIYLIVSTALSIFFGVLAFLPQRPGEYLRNRYRGAQERREKFYEPLIEDVSKAIKDLEEYRRASKPVGLKEEHLSLLISKKAREKVKELMGLLDEFERAYHDLKFYVYLRILDEYVKYDLEEVEKKYFTNLGVVSSDSPRPFASLLREPYRVLPHFLKYADADREIQLLDFSPLRGLLSQIERAHVDRDLESLLNRILGYMKGSFTLVKVLELRRRCLDLSKVVYELLRNESSKLSSKILGVVYGSGNSKLLNDYVEGRGSKTSRSCLLRV
jgi:hypothetical protein